MRAQGTLPLTAAKRRSIRKTGVYRYPRIQTCALDNFTFAPPKKVEGRVAEVEKSEDDSPMWESFGCSPVLNFASKAEDAEQKKEEKNEEGSHQTRYTPSSSFASTSNTLEPFQFPLTLQSKFELFSIEENFKESSLTDSFLKSFSCQEPNLTFKEKEETLWQGVCTPCPKVSSLVDNYSLKVRKDNYFCNTQSLKPQLRDIPRISSLIRK